MSVSTGASGRVSHHTRLPARPLGRAGVNATTTSQTLQALLCLTSATATCTDTAPRNQTRSSA